MKKILILGGAGFIGSNIALKLCSLNYEVRVLDNLSEQIHGTKPEERSPLYLSIKDKVDFIRGDINDFGVIKKAINGQDAIIHLAAETGTGQSMYEIKKYTDVNIGGTALLLDYLTNFKNSIKKIIVASSRAIYGEGKYFCSEHGIVFPNARTTIELENGEYDCKCPFCGRYVKLLPTSEDSKIHPTSVYGLTKQTQEQLSLVIGKSIGIPTIAFRYQNVYGPGQSLSNPYTGILSIFSTLIKNGNNINVFEDGRESRDFVYIDDVVDATILGLENNSIKNDVFNVGANIPIDVLSVANTLKEFYKSDIKVNISGNFRIGDIRHNYADLTKIKRDLNYEPKIDFSNGIKRFIEWVNQQETITSLYDKSFYELKSKGLLK